MASVNVSRDFVRIGERQVHFRFAGSGAPVILLHQSPRSSAELVPLLQFLAPHCLVIAPDAPGFGLSDPLKPSDAAPSIDDFCDALAGMLDQLGLAQAAIFGSHTGAIIAVRFASRYAERVTAVIANGILLTTAEERTDKAERYLPRFVPSWDGSHLAWLWSRLRDQLIFYPWYRRDPVNRICWPQSLQDIEDGALDLLQSGDNYRGAYGAVLDYAIAEDLPHLRVPTLLLVARTDALSRFVEHYPALPACVKVEVVADFPDIPAATLAWLKAHAAPAASLPRKVAVPAHGYTS
jgi:pimeloyl-ACP methyl ester carboxylesterase